MPCKDGRLRNQRRPQHSVFCLRNGRAKECCPDNPRFSRRLREPIPCRTAGDVPLVPDCPATSAASSSGNLEGGPRDASELRRLQNREIVPPASSPFSQDARTGPERFPSRTPGVLARSFLPS